MYVHETACIITCVCVGEYTYRIDIECGVVLRHNIYICIYVYIYVHMYMNINVYSDVFWRISMRIHLYQYTQI